MGTFEEEIRQNVFKNDIRKAMLNIMYTANWIRDSHSHIFKRYDILQQHYNVLRIVKGKKGETVSPGQIIKVMLDKGRDLTRLVDKLVKNGYLERCPSEVNKRKIDITITQKGIEITNEIESKLESWTNTHLGITEEKAKDLNANLDMFRGEN